MEHRSKRIGMSIFGVLACGLSVGLLRHAALGVDPFQSLVSGLGAVLPIHFGTLYVMVNCLLLLFSLVFDRRKIGLGTLINLFLLGYAVEFSENVVKHLLPSPTLAVRLLMFLIGIVAICFSSAFYFTADLGVSTYDAVSLIWSERQKRIPFSLCRVISDLVCVLLGLGLCLLAGYSATQIGGILGVGTIITAFFMGPLIGVFKRRCAEPFLYGRSKTV